MPDERVWTWRVDRIPRGTTRQQLESFFVEADRSHLVIESLVPESIAPDLFNRGATHHYLTATISFRAHQSRRPQLVDDLDGKIGLDADFYGFTSLYSPEKTPIAADVIAVTGLAGHAFDSWTHSQTSSRTRMWLRDHLPKGVPNIRVLIYGYPSGMENSLSTISLFEHSNNFKERLLAMRYAAQCEMRPIIFIGHDLGGLIVKRVVIGASRMEESLPVRSFIFLGTPHRGLEITALKALVLGTSSESIVNELKEGSSVLGILDHDFERYFRRSTCHILTCYESNLTPTVQKSSNGSWTRDGRPIMMVTRAQTHLGYEDKEIGVYSDHCGIAKIDLGAAGPFLSIKQAIDRAIENNLQKSSLGYPALQPTINATLRHSVSTTLNLGDDKNSKTGLTPGIVVPSRYSKSLSDTEGKNNSGTATGPKTSRRRTARVGEDIPINSAIQSGDIANVRKSLKEANIDKLDSEGYTPLMVAAATDQEVIVQDLIRRGASLNISGPEGDTAFHLACRHGGVPVVSVFLKYPELLYTRGAEGRTPLMSSIQSSRADIAKLLLDSTDNVELSDKDEKTALHYAAMHGQTEVVRLLLINRGADQKRTTKKDGRTALHYAARCWYPRVIELLGKNGADCNASTSKQDGARSAIHLVLLKSGRTRCITVLRRYGANLEQPDGAGRTPLHWAAQHAAPDCVEWLISKKANLEARTCDSHEKTALHIAVEAGRVEVAKILLDAGSNIDAAMKPPFGKTALHIATEENKIDLVKELLARKAKIDPILKKNASLDAIPTVMHASLDITPLAMATENGNLEIMRLLLEAGADVEGKRPTEYRPLFIAVQKSNLAAVRTLLNYNAAPQTKGNATPLTEASEAGNIPIMKELLAMDVRADVERTNIKGYPCLFIAASLGHVDAVELLLDHGADADRDVVVKKLFSSKKIRKAGEYFESDVSEESRRRIREMLA